MDTKQFDAQVVRVNALAKKWEPMLDLPGINVEHRFVNTRGEDDPLTAADTEVKWEYRWAVIRWYVPTLASMDDAELESVLVHEYCHVLLGIIPTSKITAHDEHATENVSRALLGVHRSK